MRIAFITADLTSSMSRAVWSGIKKYANEQDVECFCLSCGFAENSGNEQEIAMANYIYDILQPDTIDGIIIYGGDIEQYVGAKETESFIQKYSFCPTVSVSFETPVATNILTDNYSGMFEMVSHLIVQHNCKKLAFVKGPDGHGEADQRFSAFKNALIEHNIPLDSQRVLPGEFSPESGRDAVRTLIENRIEFDALVCVDDDSAVGAYAEMKKQGIRVPHDVLLTGFDDAASAAIVDVPLTTIKQSLVNLGIRATEQIISLCQGNKVESPTIVPSEVIYRQSCGCIEKEYKNLEMISTARVPIQDPIERSESRKEIVTKLAQIIESESLPIPKEILPQLVESLHNSLEKLSFEPFLSELRKLIVMLYEHGEYCYHIQELLTILHSGTNSCLTETGRQFGVQMIHAARILVGRNGEHFRGLLHQESVEKLGEINCSLNTLHSLEELGDKFSEIADSFFENLGINAFHLGLFTDSENPMNESKLAFSWSIENQSELSSIDTLFKTNKLLPDHLSDQLKHRNFILSGIQFKDEHYGFSLVDIPPHYAQVAEVLAWQIGSAIKRVLLSSEEVARSTELQNSLDSVRSMQKQLVESEKMASLGNLVAGVAHEINTPIGLGVTYASLLQESTNNFDTLFKSGQLKKSDFESFMNKTRESCKSLLLNMERAAELIRSFKSIAVAQTTSEKRSFLIGEYINEILTSLHGSIRKSSHSVAVDCPEDLSINSYPGVISQILTNFINNSILHGFEGVENGCMKITVTSDTRKIRMIYSDNGVGINDEQRTLMFEPFYTTKRGSGGTGLGMHIVYNLITQQLNGTIKCNGSLGNGIQFIIDFPV